MILLELDPNVVKPGWLPLLILIGLGLVMALLFRSMRRQFQRVDAHWPEDAARQADAGLVQREPRLSAAAESDLHSTAGPEGGDDHARRA